MLIFGSRDPRDFNTKCPWEVRCGCRSAHTPKLAHEHNPILASFRRVNREFWHGVPIEQIANDWISLLEEDPAMEEGRKWGYLVGSSPERITHARKVLTAIRDRLPVILASMKVVHGD